VTLTTWIDWAYSHSDTPHRYPCFVLARHASRDLGAEITGDELEKAMVAAGFAVHHRNGYGSAYLLAEDSPAKRHYDYRKHVMCDPIEHPLTVTPDARAEFLAMPAADREKVVTWLKASLVAIRRTRTLAQIRIPCTAVTGVELQNPQIRGALLIAGFEAVNEFRFRCCLTREAFSKFRHLRQESASCVQP
jgi:hypothetical protein